MNCELAQTTVHGYFDGELDVVRAAEFERHLATCTECEFSLDSMKALRARLQHSELCHHASSHLREQLQKELRLTSSAPFAAPRLRRHFWVPVLAALALAAWSAFFLGTCKAQSARITAELIDAHVRSLQPNHLTDIHRPTSTP